MKDDAAHPRNKTQIASCKIERKNDDKSLCDLKKHKYRGTMGRGFNKNTIRIAAAMVMIIMIVIIVIMIV